MQIFEQKYTTKMIFLYTLQNTIFQRSLRGKAALVGYVVARGEVFSSCMCAGVRTCTSREHYIYITPSMAQSPNEHRSRSRNGHTTCRH